jgi:hypothetical protein
MRSAPSRGCRRARAGLEMAPSSRNGAATCGIQVGPEPEPLPVAAWALRPACRGCFTGSYGDGHRTKRPQLVGIVRRDRSAAMGMPRTRLRRCAGSLALSRSRCLERDQLDDTIRRRSYGRGHPPARNQDAKCSARFAHIINRIASVEAKSVNGANSLRKSPPPKSPGGGLYTRRLLSQDLESGYTQRVGSWQQRDRRVRVRRSRAHQTTIHAPI